jgi:phage shock protein A
MAGFASRLRRITVSRIHAFLETVEDPETIFPQLIREMKSSIGEAQKAESKAAAALKANQRRLDEFTGRSIRLAKGAELAMRQGDESLAREALAEQVRVDRMAEEQRRTFQQSEAAFTEVREGRMHLEAQLAELKHHKNELLARSRSVKKASGTYRSIEGTRATGKAILDEVSRIQRTEDEKGYMPGLGISVGIHGRSLEDKLRILEQEAEIDRRLNSIIERKKSNGAHKGS